MKDGVSEKSFYIGYVLVVAVLPHYFYFAWVFFVCPTYIHKKLYVSFLYILHENTRNLYVSILFCIFCMSYMNLQHFCMCLFRISKMNLREFCMSLFCMCIFLMSYINPQIFVCIYLACALFTCPKFIHKKFYVFIWYVLHESTRISYLSISNVYFLHVLQYLQEVAHANFVCPTWIYKNFVCVYFACIFFTCPK